MGPLKLTPLGFQQIGAIALADAIGLTVPAGANVAVLTALAAAVAWRDDGTAPTAAIGNQIAAGATLEYYGNLNAIQFILVTGSPTLNVSYYKIAG